MKNLDKYRIWTLCLLFVSQQIAIGQLSKPSDVVATNPNCTTITLNWTAVPNATGYNVSENHKYIQTVYTNSITISYSSNETGNSYSYKLQAFDDTNQNNVIFSSNSDLVFASLCSPNEGPNPAVGNLPTGISGNYNLVFQDEFSNGQIDATKWQTQYRWGPDIIINNEDQYYVDQLNNPNFGYAPFSFDSGGVLSIKGDHKPAGFENFFPQQDYFSGVLTSVDNFTYGYYEVRAKLPAGKGLWPAFWLLNSFEGNPPVREIDIMEFTGGDRTAIFHNYHYSELSENNPNNSNDPNWDPIRCHKVNTRQTRPDDFTSSFHTFGVEWTENYIAWYIDGDLQQIVVDDNCDGNISSQEYTNKLDNYSGNFVSDQTMYILLNLAIGETNLGTGGDGPPNSDTNFPAHFDIDYVRVYQKSGIVESIDKPTGLSATDLSCTSVSLTWDALPNATGYNLSQNHKYIQTVYTNSVTIDYSSDEMGNSYSYKLQAFNDSNPNSVIYSPTSDLAFATLCTPNEGANPAVGDLPPSLVCTNYNLVFEDDFANGQIDASKWQTQMRWGPDIIINNEDQYYVDQLNNPGFGYEPFSFDNNTLKIKGDHKPAGFEDFFPDQDYFSGVLTSVDNFTYGYYEVRAKLPAGKGLWPAFWLLNSFEGNPPVREIDIMEFAGGDRTSVFNNYHYSELQENNPNDPNDATWDPIRCHKVNTRQTLPDDFTSTFHTFGVEWKEDYIAWYIDGQLQQLILNENCDGAIDEQEYNNKVDSYTGPFISDQSMYLLLNLAIGQTDLGTEGDGSPDANTNFPAQFEIDYVRVYQNLDSNPTNSVAWNPAPTTVIDGPNDVMVEYNVDQDAQVVIQLFNKFWNQIGQAEYLVSSGSQEITITLTPNQTPTDINYMQVKLLKPDWTTLNVQLDQATVLYDNGLKDCTDVSKVLTGNINPSGTEYYFDFVALAPNLVLNQSTNATYFAKNYILIQENASIELGAELILDIENCDTDILITR